MYLLIDDLSYNSDAFAIARASVMESFGNPLSMSTIFEEQKITAPKLKTMDIDHLEYLDTAVRQAVLKAWNAFKLQHPTMSIGRCWKELQESLKDYHYLDDKDKGSTEYKFAKSFPYTFCREYLRLKGFPVNVTMVPYDVIHSELYQKDYTGVIFVLFRNGMYEELDSEGYREFVAFGAKSSRWVQLPFYEYATKDIKDKMDITMEYTKLFEVSNQMPITFNAPSDNQYLTQLAFAEYEEQYDSRTDAWYGGNHRKGSLSMRVRKYNAGPSVPGHSLSYFDLNDLVTYYNRLKIFDATGEFDVRILRKDGVVFGDCGIQLDKVAGTRQCPRTGVYFTDALHLHETTNGYYIACPVCGETIEFAVVVGEHTCRHCHSHNRIAVGIDGYEDIISPDSIDWLGDDEGEEAHEQTCIRDKYSCHRASAISPFIKSAKMSTRDPWELNALRYPQVKFEL